MLDRFDNWLLFLQTANILLLFYLRFKNPFTLRHYGLLLELVLILALVFRPFDTAEAAADVGPEVLPVPIRLSELPSLIQIIYYFIDTYQILTSQLRQGSVCNLIGA